MTVLAPSSTLIIDNRDSRDAVVEITDRREMASETVEITGGGIKRTVNRFESTGSILVSPNDCYVVVYPDKPQHKVLVDGGIQ